MLARLDTRRQEAQLKKAEATVGHTTRRVREAHADFGSPEGYSLICGGAAAGIEDTNRSMLLAIILALFFVFATLAIQYENISSPLGILASLPFAIIGVALIMHCTGKKQQPAYQTISRLSL